MRWRYIHLIVSALLAMAATPALAVSLYQVGNSLTWDSRPAGIAGFAAQDGHSLNYGYHLKSASSLKTIWDNPSVIDIDLTSFGKFSEALPNNEWDFIALQSARSNPQTMGDDLNAYLNFVNLARSNPANADTKFYLYAPWPWVISWGPWENNVVDSLSTVINTQRHYYEHLAERVSQSLGEHVHMIPAGEVLKRIDVEARAGNIPGISTVADLYRDAPHMNAQGSYIASLTVYTTLFGEDPRGNPVPAEWSLSDVPASRIALYQNIVWDVLANHPYTGVVTLRKGDYNGDGAVNAGDVAIWQDAVDHNSLLHADANGDRVVDESDRDFWEWSFNLHETAFPGDYNSDDQVDLQDFGFWKSNYGTTLAAADGNLDGKVTAADYTVWRDGLELYEVSWLADFDDDGEVDEADLVMWEEEEGSAWDLAPDLNDDLLVDELDLAILQQNFYDPTPKYHGDFDGDGEVDLEDYDIWVADFGKYFTLRADANNNRVIDNGDYDIWFENYSSGAGTGEASVPEPSPLILCLSALALLVAKRTTGTCRAA